MVLSEPTDGDGASNAFDDLPGKSTSEQNSARSPTSKRLVRAGWWVILGGVPVTLFGSYLIAAGGKSPRPFATSVHKVGLLILLIGLVIALVGYRFVWLVDFFAIEFPPSVGASRRESRKE